jgi:hypothetical protein
MRLLCAYNVIQNYSNLIVNFMVCFYGYYMQMVNG